ncbi:MAG: NADH-quinone oxidoreductase subunit J [Desulfuromonadales bacterium]|nr:NADH-quinone oxidoreductase subunit J [Desulfuromonadales bacterium]
MELLFFYLVALIAVISGFLVVKCQSPVNSAISLVMTFFCLAVFYVMLHAPFMAAIQILVYAGAIMVLILFVIMLLNLGAEANKRYAHSVAGGALAGVVVLLMVFYFLRQGEATGMKGPISTELIAQIGHTELIGRTMLTDFLLPFEIASILLLVAIVGAIVLAKKEV